MNKPDIGVYDPQEQRFLGVFPETNESFSEAQKQKTFEAAQGRIVWVVYFSNKANNPVGEVTA